MTFVEPRHSGVGVHFTVYELVDGHWVPELFLISNWADPQYRSLRPAGVGVTRETYHTIADVAPQAKHRQAGFRLGVHEWLLDEQAMLIYNNGDPLMFNSAASAVLRMLRALARRGNLKRPGEIETYLALARRPIEVVSRAQSDFCREGTRVVGGRPHDLAVTPDGRYFSTTGDA
jgi:hypothetical protein